jgi:hypothetical protein
MLRDVDDPANGMLDTLGFGDMGAASTLSLSPITFAGSTPLNASLVVVAELSSNGTGT